MIAIDTTTDRHLNSYINVTVMIERELDSNRNRKSSSYLQSININPLDIIPLRTVPRQELLARARRSYRS